MEVAMTEQLLTSAEAAEILGVKPETIRKYVSVGILVSTKRAGRNFFHLQAVESLKDRPRRGRPRKNVKK